MKVKISWNEDKLFWEVYGENSRMIAQFPMSKTVDEDSKEMALARAEKFCKLAGYEFTKSL